MQIVVLGMHRTGTSALTRVLALMGCHLGDGDEFNPAEPDNPKGYWERRDVWALDREILSAADASWCNVGDLDLDRIDADRRATLEGRARALVAGLDARRPWAIKDPRLCLTLPLWRSALECPVCVITLRRPIQVAQSLQQRNGFPIVVGLALWEKYVRLSLRNSAGLPRVFVDHADLIDDPSGTSGRVRRELEQAGVSGLRDPDRRELEAFIDSKLFRARRGVDEESRLLSGDQRELLATLDTKPGGDEDPPPPASAEVDDLLRGFFGALEYEGRSLPTVALREELVTTQRARDEKAARVEELAGQLDRANADLRALDGRLAEAVTRRDELDRELDVALHRIQELEASHEEQGRSLDAALDRADRTGERLAARDAELEGARRHLDGLSREVDDARRAGAELERELDAGLGCARELQALVDLVLASGRWRLADRIGEGLRRVRLQPRQPVASEHRDRIVEEVERWRTRVRERYGLPSGE